MIEKVNSSILTNDNVALNGCVRIGIELGLRAFNDLDTNGSSTAAAVVGFGYRYTAGTGGAPVNGTVVATGKRGHIAVDHPGIGTAGIIGNRISNLAVGACFYTISGIRRWFLMFFIRVVQGHTVYQRGCRYYRSRQVVDGNGEITQCYGSAQAVFAGHGNGSRACSNPLYLCAADAGGKQGSARSNRPGLGKVRYRRRKGVGRYGSQASRIGPRDRNRRLAPGDGRDQ